MKSIKSESALKIRDEEEKRKETQAHFQKSINDIFSTLDKNNDQTVKIREANIAMEKKFRYLSEQYDLREKQLEKLNEQASLESQLHEAKMAKVQMESKIEKEILMKEKQAILEEVLATKKMLSEFEQRESLLKQQLAVYSAQYDQFQTSMQKSNDIFGTYKTELDRMTKQMKELKKEVTEWRTKYEKCNRAMLNMLTDKQAQDEYVQRSARQSGQLQKLCRTLQAERTSLLECLRTNNIERPPMPDIPDEPIDIVAPPQPTDKLDMMTANCKELKQTLANLQNQINSIRLDDNEGAASSAAKPTKSDASKTTAKKSKTKTTKTKTKKTKSAEQAGDGAGSAEQPSEVVSTEAQNGDGVEIASEANGTVVSEDGEGVVVSEGGEVAASEDGEVVVSEDGEAVVPECGEAVDSEANAANDPEASGIVEEIVNEIIGATEKEAANLPTTEQTVSVEDTPTSTATDTAST